MERARNTTRSGETTVRRPLSWTHLCRNRHFQWRKTTSCSLDQAMLFDVNIYPRDGHLGFSAEGCSSWMHPGLGGGLATTEVCVEWWVVKRKGGTWSSCDMYAHQLQVYFAYHYHLPTICPLSPSCKIL